MKKWMQGDLMKKIRENASRLDRKWFELSTVGFIATGICSHLRIGKDVYAVYKFDAEGGAAALVVSLFDDSDSTESESSKVPTEADDVASIQDAMLNQT